MVAGLAAVVLAASVWVNVEKDWSDRGRRSGPKSASEFAAVAPDVFVRRRFSGRGKDGAPKSGSGVGVDACVSRLKANFLGESAEAWPALYFASNLHALHVGTLIVSSHHVCRKQEKGEITSQPGKISDNAETLPVQSGRPKPLT